MIQSKSIRWNDARDMISVDFGPILEGSTHCIVNVSVIGAEDLTLRESQETALEAYYRANETLARMLLRDAEERKARA